MAKNEPVNYRAVAEVCNDLVKTGDKPSVRKVHKRLGGSFSTVAEHLQRWNEQQNLAQGTNAELSNELRQAILAEFGRVTLQIKETLQAQLADKDTQLKEIQDLLAEYEAKIAMLTQQVDFTQKEAQQQQLKLEKLLSATESKLQEAEKREIKLLQQFEQTRDKQHQSELRAAVAETQCKEALKRADLLERPNKAAKK